MKRFSVLAAILLGNVFVSCAAEPARTNACPAATSLTDARGWELGEGSFRAHQEGNVVTITATGENPTAAYQTVLAMQPIRISPPKFALYRKRPSAFAAQVITPFAVCATFQSSEKLKFIAVRDSSGEQRVLVEQAAPAKR